MLHLASAPRAPTPEEMAGDSVIASLKQVRVIFFPCALPNAQRLPIRVVGVCVSVPVPARTHVSPLVTERSLPPFCSARTQLKHDHDVLLKEKKNMEMYCQEVSSSSPTLHYNRPPLNAALLLPA
jgi:hypothetical protein